MEVRYCGDFCGGLEFGRLLRYLICSVVPCYFHVSWDPRYFQAPGIHCSEVFASMRAVIAFEAAENLELECMDISAAFLDGEVGAEVYMKTPEGFGEDREPELGEVPKRWVGLFVF